MDKAKWRGFASMSPELRREIAALGGRKSQQMGTAHKWTKEEAQAAGRLGGRGNKKKRPSDARKK